MSEQKIGIVYVHRHKTKGKVYVGQTWQPPSRRWRKEDSTYTSHKNCKAFYHALRKYGWDSFETEELATCTTQEELNLTEEKYIKLFDCLAPKGYNLRSICNGRSTHTPQTRAKISAAKTGKPNPFVKLKHAVFQINGVNHRKCYKCLIDKNLESEFGKCKLRVGRKQNDGHNQWCKDCRKTYRKATYKSQKIATEKKQSVYNARGKLWKELHDTPEMRKFQRDMNRKVVLQLDPQTREIIKEWEAAIDACKALKCSPSGISVACSRLGKVYKGFLWEFKIDET